MGNTTLESGKELLLQVIQESPASHWPKYDSVNNPIGGLEDLVDRLEELLQDKLPAKLQDMFRARDYIQGENTALKDRLLECLEEIRRFESNLSLLVE